MSILLFISGCIFGFICYVIYEGRSIYGYVQRLIKEGYSEKEAIMIMAEETYEGWKKGKDKIIK